MSKEYKTPTHRKEWELICAKLMAKFRNTNFDLHFVDKVINGEMKIEDVPYATPCEICKKYNQEQRNISPIA